MTEEDWGEYRDDQEPNARQPSFVGVPGKIAPWFGSRFRVNLILWLLQFLRKLPQ